MPLFPAKAVKRLRYSTNCQLASTAGAVTTQVYAMNGLFDPDITGTGHQPMGFDEMMLYFNHYCVMSCRIQCIFKGISSTKLTVCIRQDGAATPITTIDRIVELGGAVYDYLEITTTAGATKRLDMSASVARLQGISRRALTADPSLQGTNAANPAELSYFHVAVWDAAAQTGSVNVDVVLDFLAVFTEPRDATESLAARFEAMEIARNGGCRRDVRPSPDLNWEAAAPELPTRPRLLVRSRQNPLLQPRNTTGCGAPEQKRESSDGW